MVPGARLESVGPKRVAPAVGRPEHNRRALVVWLERVDLGPRTRLTLTPFPLECGLVGHGVERREEFPVISNGLLDEVAGCGGEDRLSFLAVRFEQAGSAPSREMGGQLPAEIPGILESRIDSVSAVRRMAVRGVTRDEDPSFPVVVSHCKAQIPEADMLELDVELRADRFIKELAEVEPVLSGTERHRGVEKPARAEIDAAEE